MCKYTKALINYGDNYKQLYNNYLDLFNDITPLFLSKRSNHTYGIYYDDIKAVLLNIWNLHTNPEELNKYIHLQTTYSIFKRKNEVYKRIINHALNLINNSYLEYNIKKQIIIKKVLIYP